MAHALFKVNGKQFASFDLNKTLVIGRSTDCHVCVRDSKLSRRHIRLEASEEGWIAIDLNSSNGTTVDGEPIQSRRLEDGDLIEAAPLTIIYHDVRPPTMEPAILAKQIVIDPADLAIDDEPAPVIERPPEAIAAEARKSIETVVDKRQQEWAALANVPSKTVDGISVRDRIARLPLPVAIPFAAFTAVALFWGAFVLTNWIAN